MSLEQALKEMTDAVKENSALLRELIASTDKLIILAQPVPVEVDRRKSDDHKEVAEKVIEEAKKAEAPAEKEEVPTVAEESKPLDFQEDIVKPFGKLCVSKGREAGAAILKKWGVEKISHIPEDKRRELLADILKAGE